MSVFIDTGDGRGPVDLETYGFFTLRRAGDLTPAVGRSPSVPVPNGFGERATGADAALAPRTITVDGTLAVDAPGQFVAALRALAYQCSGGAGGATARPVQLSFGTQGTTPAVRQTVLFDAATTFDRVDPQESAQFGTLKLVFVALDPRAVDAVATVLPLSTTAQACPVGTARARPVTVLNGPLSGTVSVTLTAADATQRGILTLVIPVTTVLAGHTVEIDHAAATVVHVHGGTRTPHPEWVPLAGGGDFLALDPVDCLVDLSALVASIAEGEGDLDAPGGVARDTAFDPAWEDRFATDTSAGYTLQVMTLAWQSAGVMRATTTGSAGQMDVPWTPVTLAGAQFPYVVLRYRVHAGTPALTVLYATAGHGLSASYERTAPLTADGAWHTLVLDMRQLTAGGTDWADSLITGLSLFLAGAFASVDWNAIAVASAGPTRVVGRKAPRLALSTGTGTVSFARAWR